MNGYRTGLLILSLAACVFLVFSGWAAATPPNSYSKPNVPDLDQHRPGELPDNGDYHCSPTAAANSLKWFDQQMGLDVVPDGQTDTGLINDLGTAMGTDKGTWNDNMVKGYRKYLRAHGGGRQWDVKFQGSKYFRGYTVGQNSPNVSLDWIKQELADGEDVTLTVDWYRETATGWTPLNGAHSITLDGYTSGTGTGNNSSSSLFIRDPAYPELIIERDQDSIAAGYLIYEYSTGSVNLRAEVVGAVSVSPKPAVVMVDSFFDLFEFTGAPQMTGMNILHNSIYSDYVHLGLDLCDVMQTIDAGQDLGTINIMNDLAGGLTVHFDETGILDIVDDTGIVIENNDLEVQFEYGFGDSEMMPDPHVRTELWIDRDLFGDFAVDSFFDITYEIDFDGAPGPMEMLGGIELNSQNVTPDVGLDLGPVPDTDGDGNPDNNYPDPFNSEPDPIEIAAREAALLTIPHVPGDANNDGFVNELDAELLASHWGEGDATWAMGDFNGDLHVDAKDASILAANWGAIGDLATPVSVPEPSTLMLLLGLVSGLLIRRRKG